MPHIEQISSWFAKAVPAPAEASVHVQIGVHIEEFAEMLSVFADAGNTMQDREKIAFTRDVADFLSRRFKNHGQEGMALALDDMNRVELLDALCDQIVTAVGIAHMLQLDISGALNEVLASNDSKFGADGQPLFDASRKIIKGPNYFAPDLAKFT